MDVVLVTGASSGIGFFTAANLASQGYKVYGAARRIEEIKKLELFGVVPLYLDLTDEASITKIVEEIIENEGRLDVLINNAGYGLYGAVEVVPIEEAKRQFEVNIFGLAKLTQLVLPHMRENKKGKIIMLSSIAGRLTMAMGAWYHSSKYALEAYSDALRMEVKPFGIDVVLIEPGAIKSEWADITKNHLESLSLNTVYQENAKKQAKRLAFFYHRNPFLTSPKKVSALIAKIILSERVKARYQIGFGSKSLVFLKYILPSFILDKILTLGMK